MTDEELAARMGAIETMLQDMKLRISVSEIEKEQLAKFIEKLETSINDVKTAFHDSHELILLHEKSVSNLEDEHDKTRTTTEAHSKLLNKIIGALTIILPLGALIGWAVKVWFGLG